MKGVEIRKPDQLQNVSSLIIPGGESTTMARLAEYHNLVKLSLSRARACLCLVLLLLLFFVYVYNRIYFVLFG